MANKFDRFQVEFSYDELNIGSNTGFSHRVVTYTFNDKYTACAFYDNISNLAENATNITNTIVILLKFANADSTLTFNDGIEVVKRNINY